MNEWVQDSCACMGIIELWNGRQWQIIKARMEEARSKSWRLVTALKASYNKQLANKMNIYKLHEGKKQTKPLKLLFKKI